MELMITCTHYNGFGNILYNLINQGLCFPILLTEITKIKRPLGVCVCVCIVCVCLCVCECVSVCVECVCMWSVCVGGEREGERERGMFWLQGDSLMGG